MAFLPGWDRARLLAADPADVEAARWLAFTGAVRPILDRDIEGDLEQLARADMTPKERERREKTGRARSRERLQVAKRQQAELRKILELDAPDDDEAPA
jgi:hypothetical protein